MKTTQLMVALIAVALLFAVGCERKVTNIVNNYDTSLLGSSECMKCHNDVDGRMQEAEGEWKNSVHASGTSVDYTNRGGTGSDCTRCHDHQGFVLWVDSGKVAGPFENVSAIHCFTCHAPHTKGQMPDLRTSAPYTLANGVVFDHGKANLCANCHHNRTSVTTTVVDNASVTSRFGPHHGPQADLINKTGGYEMAGYTYNTSTHATAVTDACIGCHMGSAQVHDGYKIGGHSFNMEDTETGSSMVKICTPCHAKATADFDFKADTSAAYDFDKDGTVEGYQTEFQGMMDSLATLLVAKGVMTRTISGSDTTYTPKTMTVADKNVAGAIWNYSMLHEDRSQGVHNYKYAHDLIWNSIAYLKAH